MGGWVRWNAVSKHATCGTSGSRSATASIAPRLWGWWSGASGTSARRSVITWGVTTHGFAYFAPPCTTRWPTPATGEPP